MKAFKLALCTGRYQNFTKAHGANIELAATLAEQVIVVVGSAQEAGTERNPFSIDLRMAMLSAYLQHNHLSNVTVMPLADFSNEHDICVEWGEYLLDAVVKTTGQKPDLVLHGDDGRANDPVLWFSEEDKIGMHFLMVPRNETSISGTKCRHYLLTEDKPAWFEAVPPAIWGYYTSMREALLHIPFYSNQVTRV